MILNLDRCSKEDEIIEEDRERGKIPGALLFTCSLLLVMGLHIYLLIGVSDEQL